MMEKIAEETGILNEVFEKDDPNAIQSVGDIIAMEKEKKNNIFRAEFDKKYQEYLTGLNIFSNMNIWDLYDDRENYRPLTNDIWRYNNRLKNKSIMYNNPELSVDIYNKMNELDIKTHQMNYDIRQLDLQMWDFIDNECNNPLNVIKNTVIRPNMGTTVRTMFRHQNLYPRIRYGPNTIHYINNNGTIDDFLTDIYTRLTNVLAIISQLKDTTKDKYKNFNITMKKYLKQHFDIFQNKLNNYIKSLNKHKRLYDRLSRNVYYKTALMNGETVRGTRRTIEIVRGTRI